VPAPRRELRFLTARQSSERERVSAVPPTHGSHEDVARSLNPAQLCKKAYTRVVSLPDWPTGGRCQMGAIPPVEAIPHTALWISLRWCLCCPATPEGKCFGGLYWSFRFVIALIKFRACHLAEAREESTGDQRGIFHTVVNRRQCSGGRPTLTASVSHHPHLRDYWAQLPRHRIAGYERQPNRPRHQK